MDTIKKTKYLNVTVDFLGQSRCLSCSWISTHTEQGIAFSSDTALY